MTTREGSLEAPTRHPLDWRSPEFYDEASVEKELERVFDICHGCRRCVNLCTAFPTLFDLIDESPTLEARRRDESATIGKVVDQCYLCDMCYMTKCPYVPPHPWNVDFPHLMLRAKAVKFRKNGAPAARPRALQHRRDGQARDDSGGRAVRERRQPERPGARARWKACSACTGSACCPSTRARTFRAARAARDGLRRKRRAGTRPARSRCSRPAT